MQEINSVWNSLEVAKLIVPLVETLVVGSILLIMEHRLLRKIENDRLANERRIEESRLFNEVIIQRRLKVFDEIAPILNDLACFYTYVGHWKELIPSDIIAKKRQLDRIMHVHRYLFSQELFEKYMALMTLCFETFSGVGKDAKLRTKTEDRRVLPDWKEEYLPLFADSSTCPDKAAVKSAYETLIEIFSRELGLKRKNIFH